MYYDVHKRSKNGARRSICKKNKQNGAGEGNRSVPRVVRYTITPGHLQPNTVGLHETCPFDSLEQITQQKKNGVKFSVLVLEQVKGIEPSYQAWEARVLPLNYTCVFGYKYIICYFINCVKRKKCFFNSIVNL